VRCHAEAFFDSMADAEHAANALECPAGTVLEWAPGLTPDQYEPGGDVMPVPLAGVQLHGARFTPPGLEVVVIDTDGLELPEPLGGLVAALRHRRPALATTAAADRDRWLFPGLRLDAPLHPEQMRRRLRQIGITARPGRVAALLHLAQTLPPAILADLLGLSERRAAGWTRTATGDWGLLRRRDLATAAKRVNREPSSPLTSA
jgi:hypothetical protein